MEAQNEQTLTVATWNIGGGILGESHQLHGTPQIDYHASVISELSPDIVCIQEAHVYNDGIDQIELLAQACGYEHFETTRISPSHLDPDASLALGLLSRQAIISTTYVEFPNPGLEELQSTGVTWVLFDKGFTVSRLQLTDVELQIMNAHCFPFHYFHASAEDEQLNYTWQPLRQSLSDISTEPLVACIDLNSPNIDKILPSLPAIGMKEAYERTATTPKGIQQDFICYTSKFMTLRASGVEANKSDHSLCWATLSLEAG